MTREDITNKVDTADVPKAMNADITAIIVKTNHDIGYPTDVYNCTNVEVKETDTIDITRILFSKDDENEDNHIWGYIVSIGDKTVTPHTKKVVGIVLLAKEAVFISGDNLADESNLYEDGNIYCHSIPVKDVCHIVLYNHVGMSVVDIVSYIENEYHHGMYLLDGKEILKIEHDLVKDAVSGKSPYMDYRKLIEVLYEGDDAYDIIRKTRDEHAEYTSQQYEVFHQLLYK